MIRASLARTGGNALAPLLVLLHGGGLAGWMWNAQVERFAAQYELLVPDLPGHGRSGSPFTTIRAAAAEVAGMIDAARDAAAAAGRPEQRVAIVGFSLGAQIAVELLASRPEIADRAVIISALAKPMRSSQLLLPLLGWSLLLARYRWFARLQARQSFIAEADFERYYASSNALSRASFMNMMRENLSFRIPAGWAGNPAATLVLAGSRELAAIRSSAQELAGPLPAGKLLLAEGFGHGISLQDPAWFNEVLTDWLN